MLKSKNNHIYILLIIILFSSFIFRLLGISWGLPHKSLCLRTFHPDEAAMLYPMQNFKPSQFKFDPGRLGPGDFLIYITGAGLKFASFFNIITLSNDRLYYEKNLWKTSKMYLIGRIIVNLFLLSANIILFILIKKMFNSNIALLSVLIFNLIPITFTETIIYYPHIPVILPVLLSFYFSYNIIYSNDYKNYLLAGLFAGLASGIIYTGGFIIICVIIATWINSYYINHKFKIINIKVIYSFLICFFSFILTGPYILKYYPRLLVILDSMLNLKKNNVNYEIIDKLYYLYKGPVIGLGMPLYILGILSFIFVLYKIFSSKLSIKEKNNLLLIISGFLIYYLFWNIGKWQYSHYLITPYLFFSVIVAYFIWFCLNNYTRIKKTIFVIFFTVVLFSTGLYSYNILKVFINKDIREKVSDYIIENIPAESSIGVFSFYYSTPPVIQKIEQNKYKIINLTDNISKNQPVFSEEELFSNYTKLITTPKISDTEMLNNIIQEFEKEKPDYFIFSSSELISANYFNLFYQYFKNKNDYELVKNFDGELDILFNKYFVNNWKKEGRFLIINPSYKIFKKKI